MIAVQPAILEKDPTEIQRRLDSVRNFCTQVHLDIMDGEFVPNTTVNDPVAIAQLQWGDLRACLHLMIVNPELYLRKWAFPAVSTMIVHREAVNNLKDCLLLVRSLGKQVAIALNPHTSTYEITDLLDQLDAVMIMGVEPGFAAQGFNADVLEKIAFLRQRAPQLTIMVDGGVNAKTKTDIIKAGANVLCANSYIFKAADIQAAMTSLQ